MASCALFTFFILVDLYRELSYCISQDAYTSVYRSFF